jgi:hypothetical protein
MDETSGPAFAEELNEFLAEKRTTTLDKSLVACIWYNVINEEDIYLEAFGLSKITEQRLIRSLHRTNTYHRSFTKEQFNQMISTVNSLRNKFRNEIRLDNTFKMYDSMIKQASSV